MLSNQLTWFVSISELEGVEIQKELRSRNLERLQQAHLTEDLVSNLNISRIYIISRKPV